MNQSIITNKHSGSNNSLLLSDIEIGDEKFQNDPKIDGSVELFADFGVSLTVDKIYDGSCHNFGSEDGTSSEGATSSQETGGETYKTLIGTQIELDKEASAVVDKVYNTSIWSFVFVVIVSPLIIRYTLATSSQESLHFFSHDFWSQSSDWGTGLSILEWTILVMLTMQNFMGLVPSTSLLCGKPTSVKSGKNVQCTGQAVIGSCTPFLTENEAIFLRSLLGRFATAFHTIGSRHDIRGLYVDAIVNEVRSTEGDPRLLQWMAWVDFIDYLALLKLDDMAWPFKRSPEDPCTGSSPATGSVKEESLATAVPLLSINNDDDEEEEVGYIDKSLDMFPIIRTLNLGSRIVEYELETTNLTFKGVKTVSTHSDDKLAEHELRKSGSSEAKWDERVQDKSFHLEDLLPLVCFLDGWLEVTRRRDVNRDHNNKKVALEDIFNHAPCSKYFTGAVLIDIQRRLRELFEVFNGTNKHYRPAGRFTHISKADPFLHRDEAVEMKWNVTRAGCQDWSLAFSYWSRGKLNQDTDGTGTKILLETVKIKPGALVYLNSGDFDSWIKSRQQTFKVQSMSGASSLRLKAWPVLSTLQHSESFFSGSNVQMMAKNLGRSYSEDVETGGLCAPHSLRRSVVYDSTEVDVNDVTLYTQHRGKVGAIDTFKHYLRLRGRKWAEDVGIEVSRPQTFMAVIDARHMIVEPQIFINQALPYFAQGQSGESTKGFAPKSDCMLVQYPQYFPNVIDDTFNSRNGLHWTLNQLLQDFSKTCVSTGSNAVWDISSEEECSFLHVGNVRVDDTAATLAQIKEKLCVHFPCFVANGISRTKPVDMLDTWHRWNGGNVEMFWTIVFSRYSYLQMLGRAVLYLYLSACFLPSVYFYVAWLVFLAATTVYAIYFEKKQGKLPFRDINIIFIFLQMPTTGLFRIMNFVAMAAAPISMAFYHEIPMFATPSRKLFWVLWVFLVRQPQLHIVDNLIEICRVFNPATKKGLWDFRLVMWRACRVEGFAVPFAIMGFFEGTCNAFRALLFDADITYWNQVRVDSKEVTRRYKQMMETASYCSLEFISNALSYFSIRTQQSRRLWSTPRPWTTIYVSVMALLQVLCIIYTWLTSEDRTLIVAVLVTCMFNFLLLKDTVIALIKPVRILVSKEYQIEYMFIVFTLVLMASVLTGLSVEPLMKMLTA